MSQERIKFALRISPQTQQLVKDLCSRDNCQSQNEFIEKAIHFYAGYVSAQDSTDFLAQSLVTVIRGTLDDSENRVARLLFKMAVELSMTMNVVAAGLGFQLSDLSELRARCVEDVKKSGGRITFDDALKFQKRV